MLMSSNYCDKLIIVNATSGMNILLFSLLCLPGKDFQFHE